MKAITILTIIWLILLITNSTPTFTGKNHLSLEKDDRERADRSHFATLHKQYGKTYDIDSESGDAKFQIFRINKEKVENHNRDETQTYKMDINGPFFDLSENEFKETILMKPEVLSDLIPNFQEIPNPSDDIFKKPSFLKKNTSRTNLNINWSNLFLDARDQGQCGSCWAFASLGAAEANYASKNGPKTYFSTQQLVDCDKTDSACEGGWPSNAYDYLKTNGIVQDIDYPYTAYTQTCSKPTGSIKLIGYESCSPSNCQNGVYENLLSKGPIVTVVDGSAIQFYSTGVFSDMSKCTTINHAVIVVGMDSDLNGNQYYIVRNSWSTSWGENGYFRVYKTGNSCYLGNYAFLPEVEYVNTNIPVINIDAQVNNSTFANLTVVNATIINGKDINGKILNGNIANAVVLTANVTGSIINGAYLNETFNGEIIYQGQFINGTLTEGTVTGKLISGTYNPPLCANLYDKCSYLAFIKTYCVENGSILNLNTEANLFSSARVIKGVVISLFPNTNCLLTGSQTALRMTTDTPCFATKYTNVAKSLAIFRADSLPKQKCVWVYDNYCYSGNYKEVCAQTNIISFTTLGIRPLSIRLGPGITSVQLYTSLTSSTLFKKITSDLSNLNNNNLALIDKVQRIKIN